MFFSVLNIDYKYLIQRGLNLHIWVTQVQPKGSQGRERGCFYGYQVPKKHWGRESLWGEHHLHLFCSLGDGVPGQHHKVSGTVVPLLVAFIPIREKMNY